MRFFRIERSLRSGEILPLKGAQGHHLTRVLRLERGATLVLQDRQEKRYRACVLSVDRHSGAIELRLLEPLTTSATLPGRQVTLCQALLKPPALSLLLRQSTELGAERIVLFNAERSPWSLPSAKPARQALRTRWERIVWSACQQSGRSLPPQIALADDLKNALTATKESPETAVQRSRAASTAPPLSLVLHPPNAADDAEPIPTPPDAPLAASSILTARQILLWIGPAGGFSPTERTLLAHLPTLALPGPTLRSETAALAALSLARYSPKTIDTA